MNSDMLVEIVSMIACINSAVVVIGRDGRSSRRPRQNIFTIRTNTWEGSYNFINFGLSVMIS